MNATVEEDFLKKFYIYTLSSDGTYYTLSYNCPEDGNAGSGYGNVYHGSEILSGESDRTLYIPNVHPVDGLPIKKIAAEGFQLMNLPYCNAINFSANISNKIWHLEEIGTGAFKNLSTIKTLEFPSLDSQGSVVIKSEAFSLPALKNLTITNAFSSIEPGAFAFTRNLELCSVDLDNEYYGSYGKSNSNRCIFTKKNTKNSVIFGIKEFFDAPDDYLPSDYNVTTIGKYAFKGCEVTSVDLSQISTITTINERAFDSCYYLTSVSLSPYVTTVTSNPFTNCPNLTTIQKGILSYPLKNTILSTGNCLWNSTTGALITGCAGSDLTGLEGLITSIEKYAFYNSGVESVVIPESVSTIKGYAFYDSSSIRSVEFKGKPTIETYAFYKNSYLDTITGLYSKGWREGETIDGTLVTIIYDILKNIFLGTNGLKKIYFKDKEVKSAYLGEKQIF